MSRFFFLEAAYFDLEEIAVVTWSGAGMYLIILKGGKDFKIDEKTGDALLVALKAYRIP